MRLSLPLVLFFAAVATLLRAAPAPEPTAKEIAQGYSDRVVLAKPLAAQRGHTEFAEASDGLRVRERFEAMEGLSVIEVTEGESVPDVVSRLKATGRYEFVEPDYLMKYDAIPNDARFSTQWNLNNTGQTGGLAGADMRAVAAWDVINDASSVIVAVIDTGVNVNHEDIAANLWRNPSPTIGDINGIRIVQGLRSADLSDEVGHGSHVVGIVGAAGNNGVGIAGVAWRVQLMIVKNGTASGSFASDSAAAVDYAVARGARVINCSFGGVNVSQAFLTALTAARNAGVIVCCSAGNDGQNNDLFPHYPSNYLLDNIVAVGNSNASDGVSTSSDVGMLVELFAPGSSILSLSPTSTSAYATLSGTSMASPHATGVFALMRARFPQDTHRQLINRVMRTVDKRPAYAGRALSGGRINLLNAVNSTDNRPFNDDFSAAAPITGDSVTVRGNNAGATTEAGERAHAAAGAGATLWWQWAPSAGGNASIDTNGSAYDTTLAIYTGSTLGGLTLVAENDNNGSATSSMVRFTAQPNTTYYIATAGKNGATGATIVNFGIGPPNDFFANAEALPNVQSTRVAGTVRRASAEPGEPRILNASAGTTAWYRWTAPRSGRFQVSAVATVFDPLLAIYTGLNLGQLTLVTENDNTGPDLAIDNSVCTFDAVAGTTYFIQVDAAEAVAAGEFTLTLVDSLWQAATGGYVATSGALRANSPAIAPDGTIYIGGGGTDRALYAFRPDGTLKWSYTAGGVVDSCTPAIGTDGTLYFGTTDGRFTALTPAGAVRWQRSLGTSPLPVSPALAADGTIYTHAVNGTFYALNPADGSTRWSTAVGAQTFSSPVVAADGTIYQASSTRGLVALNPDGTLKWEFATNTGGASSETFASPALDAAGNIYFTTYTTPRLFSVAPDGTQRWVYNVTGTTSALISGSAVLSADGSTAYFGANNRTVYAINTADGTRRWENTVGSSVLATSPVVDRNGVIYVGSYDFRLAAFNPDGSFRRTWDTAGAIRSSPVISGTVLYVSSNDGKLYAIDLGVSAADGPWPQFRQNARRTGRGISETFAIAGAPAAQIVAPGTAFTLSASVSGRGPHSFQWMRDGVAIAGATSSTLTVAAAGPATTGSYTVVVTGPTGALTSSGAAISLASITPNNNGRLINLSILTAITTPGDAFTMGYVVGGNGTAGAKPLVIRAAGPSLVSLGVPNFLTDPKIELFAGPAATTNNDDWGGSAALTNAMAAVGAFPFTNANSFDAATLASITSRDNSVRVSAIGSGTGTVIAEVYDATPSGAFTASTPRLLNVSVLKHIGSGLTAGFVIGGGGSKTVLIRAVGPTLGAAPFGISGVVADPQLTLFGAGATRLDANDNWGGGQVLLDAFNAVGAFALPGTSRDAALVATLAPGSYSVEVKGAGNTTGIALVEVYEVP